MTTSIHKHVVCSIEATIVQLEQGPLGSPVERLVHQYTLVPLPTDDGTWRLLQPIVVASAEPGLFAAGTRYYLTVCERLDIAPED